MTQRQIVFRIKNRQFMYLVIVIMFPFFAQCGACGRVVGGYDTIVHILPQFSIYDMMGRRKEKQLLFSPTARSCDPATNFLNVLVLS